jgi:carboxylesterase type B
VGAPQYPCIRRGPEPGHDRRGIGRRLVGVRAAGVAARPWPVQRRNHGKRQLRHPERRCRAGRRARVRRQRGLPAGGDGGGLPAQQARGVILDASSSLQSRTITSGGPELPVAGAQAVASGRYTRVPVLMGTNHDEGRTFTQGFASLTEQQYVQLVDQQAGPLAPAILRRYPWSAYPSPYTASYAIGAIWTDSGFIAGIGGCPTQNLAAEFASTTPTFLYQFDDRHAPALNHLLPGYQWGAGHAMELAYLWPSFGNGFSLYDLLTPAQLELSHQMLVWWGAFTRTGAPAAPGQPAWPRYTSRRLMSLRPGDQSRLISGGTFAAQHQCPFWNATG